MDTTIRDKTQWFVLRVKWRHEFDVAQLLTQQGVESFVAKRIELVSTPSAPRHKQKKEVVVIPEIVFVHSTHRFLNDFLRLLTVRHHYVVYFATTTDNAHRTIMIVPDKQMESFIQVAKHYEQDIRYFSPDDLSLSQGDTVRICGGPFDGAIGTLTRIKGQRDKRVFVKIENIATVVTAALEPEYIEVLSSAHTPKSKRTNIS